VNWAAAIDDFLREHEHCAGDADQPELRRS
jgi:hypothetical protein